MKHRFYDATNDVAFKRLFAQEANKPLLISFLNSVLRRKGEDIIEDVEILPPELVPTIAEAKRSILDVRCRDRKNFQYIIEMQNRNLSSFIQRIQYYVSRTYSSQIAPGDTYLELKPVILLAILNHKIFPDKIEAISYHHTLESKTQGHYLKDLSYAFVELEKFTKSADELQTDEDQWLYLLKSAWEIDNPPSNAPEEVVQAYHTLEQFQWNDAEREAYERAHMAIMDDFDALQTSREEGLKEGREEGREEAKLEIARALKKQGLPLDQISLATDLSIEKLTRELGE